MTSQTWEERDLAIHKLFMARLKELMETGDVSQSELARRMGGGVTQGNVSRWLGCTGTKMTPGRFGTAVRALGEDPAKQFSAVVAQAREMGLMEPGTAVARKKSPRAQEDTAAINARVRRLVAERDAMNLLSEQDAMIAAEHEEPGMLLAARVANDDDEAEAQNNEA